MRVLDICLKQESDLGLLFLCRNLSNDSESCAMNVIGGVLFSLYMEECYETI